jgi:protease-4
MDDDLKPSAGPQWEREVLEKLAFSVLREQQSARRARNAWRIVWLLLLAFGIWFFWIKNPAVTAPSIPHTAVIEVKGEIGGEGESNASNVIDSLRAASTMWVPKRWCW